MFKYVFHNLKKTTHFYISVLPDTKHQCSFYAQINYILSKYGRIQVHLEAYLYNL